MVENKKTISKREELPAGFNLEHGVAYGSRVKGLFEIKFHGENKNAMTTESNVVLARILTFASSDPNTKCVLMHGGKYFGSGNNLKVLMGWMELPTEGILEVGRTKMKECLVPYLKALKNCEKPVVAVVRGGCHGIHFTPLTLCDFVYCGPDATFTTPFMGSFQSPEGLSTLLFPQQLGVKRANEILYLDRSMTASEAVQCGFANAIIEDLGDSDWFNPEKIPAISKLLASDFRTIVNMKRLMIKAQDQARLDKLIEDECESLV
jgi:enoyl-CoA hydratase/carnithine racemase